MEAVRRKRRLSFLSVVSPRDSCLSRAWRVSHRVAGVQSALRDGSLHTSRKQFVFSTLTARF